MIQRDVSIKPIESYFADLYFLGQAQERLITFNHGEPLALPARKISIAEADTWWVILAWILPIAACTLALSSLACLVSRGIWSFETGRYLSFTWRLGRSPFYQG